MIAGYRTRSQYVRLDQILAIPQIDARIGILVNERIVGKPEEDIALALSMAPLRDDATMCA
jgi:hypothetical protein